MDGDALKAQALQWLNDGGQIEAAGILKRCDLVERYLDEVYPPYSDDLISVFDLEVFASYRDKLAVEQDERNIGTQIEIALHEFTEPGEGIRNIVWRGKVQETAVPVDGSSSVILASVDTASVREA
jgi:hypothetical protein